MSKKQAWDGVEQERGLELCEIETGLYFNKTHDGTAIISSNDVNIMSRLINCDFFNMENFRTEKHGRKNVLVYVDGTIPIGAINIGKPRATNSTNKIVKAPKESKKTYTEKQKKQMAKNLEKAREVRLNGLNAKQK